MSTLARDARGFVDGVVGYLKHDGSVPGSLPKVRDLLHKVTARTQKEKVAAVASSVALVAAEKQRLAAALARIIGHSVELECTVAPHLLGGMKVAVGDWVVDTSLSGQLEAMAQGLIANNV